MKTSWTVQLPQERGNAERSIRFATVTLILALVLAFSFLVGFSGAQAYASLESPLADGSGVATFLPPARVQAGMNGQLTMVFTATVAIQTNGSIQIKDPDFHGRFFLLSQSVVSAVSSNPGVTLAISKRGSSVSVRIASGVLNSQDVVTITLNYIPPVRKAYQQVSVSVVTDADGNGTFQPLSASPRFDIDPYPERDALVATGPSYVQTGVPFTLTLRVLDRFGNPALVFTDPIVITATDPLAELPPDPLVFPSGQAVLQIPVTFHSPGFRYIYALGPGTLQANSNPFLVVESLADQPGLYWGDLHGHFGHVYTDSASRRIDEYMQYARYVSDLDFTAETPKSNVNLNSIAVQAEVQESVFLYDDPGSFVTIRGYEWTGQLNDIAGHHNVYFSTADAPAYYSAQDAASNTLPELWALIGPDMPPGEQALTPPHALCYTCPNCWSSGADPGLSAAFRPMVEVVSMWGSSEEGCQSCAQWGLVLGNRFGFYGSSDTHWAFPGNTQPEKLMEETPAGLAAVYADELTRTALWQSFSQRYAYATDGDRIFLDFTVDGFRMGSEITATVTPQIALTAAGTAPISFVEVIRGTYVTDPGAPGLLSDYFTTIFSANPDTLTFQAEFTDTTFSASAFYYVRITQANGKHAWASPIWVDFEQPNPPLNQIQNGGFENNLDFWLLELVGAAQAEIYHDPTTAGEGTASARVEVTQPASYLRSTRFIQNGVSLDEGKMYTLSFWAKADINRQIRILLRPATATWQFYNSYNVNLDADWQHFQFSFIASVSDVSTVLEFSLGQFASTVWVDGVELTEGQPLAAATDGMITR